MTFAIRPLTAADAAAYNAFFTAGTLAHPATLRITPGDVAAAPFDTDGTLENTTFAAFDEAGAFAGVGTVAREKGREKRRHIAWIVRMYVAEEHAGRGIGRAILQAAIAQARRMPGVAKVNLTVAADNAGAARLYASEGFVTFAREVDAFRNGATPETELTMSLVL